MIMGVLAQSSAPVRNLDLLASPGRHDRNPEINDRINALIRKMTLSEKNRAVAASDERKRGCPKIRALPKSHFTIAFARSHRVSKSLIR
jgi:hypothetical protein